jgi:general secretion pathway protein H
MSRNGFTLVELLVVLAIIAMICIITVPPSLSDRPETERTAREVAAALRESRSRAIFSNAEVVFSLDVKRHYFKVSGDDQAHALPPNLRLSLSTVQQEGFGWTGRSIRFFPDGSSTGGRIALSDSRNTYQVTVNWLTGHVEILD